MAVTREQLEQLKQDMPYKMRQGPKGVQLAYIDARQAMDLLDEVVGPENWQCDYRQVKNVVYCGVAVLTESGWVWKWDAGDESNIDAEKGEASDAFKRAAVRWGVGRFLYSLGDVKKLPAQPKVPAPPPKPAAPVKTDPRPESPLTDAGRAKLTQVCKDTGWVGNDFKELLAELELTWKGLTNADADALINYLTTDPKFPPI